MATNKNVSQDYGNGKRAFGILFEEKEEKISQSSVGILEIMHFFSPLIYIRTCEIIKCIQEIKV